MVKDKYVNLWKIGFILAVIGVFISYIVIYMFRPPDITQGIGVSIGVNDEQIAIMFLVTFFPSVVSRIYANWKTGQADISVKGIVESFRDSIHGWYSYYILAFIAFIIWDYMITGKFPWAI